ncbi:PrsW family intramembrane metalloprotease [bacterium]|nr:PrsW family intramembrane metalloprotease [bacterium]
MAEHIVHNPKHKRHIGLTLAVALAASLIYFSWQGGFAELSIAAGAGAIPAFFWLWFWLHEDNIHPEPKGAIFKSFFFGALAVPVAIGIEQIIDFAVRFFAGIPDSGTLSIENLSHGVAFLLFLLWAVVEEYAKYRAADLGAIEEPDYDEPIDAPMYLISAAIGFSAFESLLFVWQTIFESGAVGALFVSQLRFLGASLLHVVASSVVGFSIGFSFYGDARKKRIFLGLGLLTAILLHTLFNFFIITLQGGGALVVFTVLWIATIGIFLLFEKIKQQKVPLGRTVLHNYTYNDNVQ